MREHLMHRCTFQRRALQPKDGDIVEIMNGQQSGYFECVTKEHLLDDNTLTGNTWIGRTHGHVRVERFTLTATDIANGYVELAGDPRLALDSTTEYQMGLSRVNVVSGQVEYYYKQNPGDPIEYSFDSANSRLVFNFLQPDSFQDGDELVVTYE